MAKQLKITQLKSVIGSPEDQRQTMTALGLKKIRQVVTQPDNPATRGMVLKVRHLVKVEEVD
ncbi:MAG: 50S ribosomal protein L30 [Actinomycetaceae bacterium]|nr:50S ribosomal protein L30 [Actinomycetaceae bacterium]